MTARRSILSYVRKELDVETGGEKVMRLELTFGRQRPQGGLVAGSSLRPRGDGAPRVFGLHASRYACVACLHLEGPPVFGGPVEHGHRHEACLFAADLVVGLWVRVGECG